MASAPGIWNVMRRMVPKTVATARALVLALGPETAGFNVTITFAAGIVPLGNPDPVTLTRAPPACAALGEVGELRVTFCAHAGVHELSTIPARARTIVRGRCELVWFTSRFETRMFPSLLACRMKAI